MPQDEDNPLPARLAAATVAADRVSIAFRDRAFRSRTLVFADGTTLAVEKSHVTATTQEHVSALERHPDFERVADGS
ncbi:hypothetical protein [Paraburkholderia terricola]|uniref:hypothetical protein n=1 Tax=Paraburkholderia terricola TaxID=169427 RepID=UPI0009F2CDD4|nr:hypothetical protein [Paraburkholderia terricola]AXE91702.1 hypothetical protein CUJ90_04410 [Paraburkholderia terricola]ORC47105.1 hypothetical protein B2G74_24315 [Burkholderia sp. A27]